MRTRAIGMLALALLLSAAAVVLARNWLESQAGPAGIAQPEAPMPMKRVVVAAQPLRYGAKLGRAHLRVVDWPASSVPEGAFGSIEEVLGGEQSEPRVALRAVAPDEPLLRSRLTGFGGRASLSTLIAPGMRASTIRVNDVNGVAGFVLPGDRVDVLLTRAAGGIGGRGGDMATDILLQNMKVLGVDQDADEERDAPAVVRTVTLEVTAVQAQKLTLAQTLGTLSLALRHFTTADAEALRTVTVRDLRPGQPAFPPVPDLAAEKLAIDAPVAPASLAAGAGGPDLAPVRIVRGLRAYEYHVEPGVPHRLAAFDLISDPQWPEAQATPATAGFGNGTFGGAP